MRTARTHEFHRDRNNRIRVVLRFRYVRVRRPARRSSEGQGVSHGRHPRGVTLLELIVVIVLLGLVLAIAAPSLIAPKPSRESELATVLGTARRAAILRGEPVTLSFDDAGAWRIDADANAGASPIASGKLVSPPGQLRVRVSVIGTCVGEPSANSANVDWNAVDCRLAPANRGALRQ